MPFAAADTAGFAPARFNGRDIPEIDLASGKLGTTDCHFGINGKLPDAVVNELKMDDDLKTLGPRAIDVAVRGGIVAETLWREFQAGGAQQSAQLQAFLLTFDDIGAAKALAPGKMAYGAGAKISGDAVTGHEKYKAGATNKTMASISESDDDGSSLQLGTRWSKVAIENTIRKKGTVHFHLDGMGNIHDIVSKAGDYSHNVTSRELRYIYRNRARQELMKAVIFYNGFQKSGGGVYKAVIVKCPWN